VRRVLAAIAVLALAGCGDDAAGGEGRLVVSAASSLKQALPEYAPDASYSFAGSDELAAQIRAGVRPDVFAAANTKLPDALYAEGLVEKPVVFATNELVVAVPAGDARVRSFADLGRRGVTIAVGADSVPVGAYNRQVLDRLPAAERARIEARVKTREPDVAGVVGKVAQGAVDAGFVYATDVKGAGGKLEAIAIPAELQPSVRYGAAVVKGAKHPEQARAYVDGLPGAPPLTAAGFGTP